MKKLVLLACLGLAACNVSGSGSVPISNVQKETVAICGFLPLAQVVAAIIAKHSANLDSVFAIATAICSAVTPKPTARSARMSNPMQIVPLTVAGVVIKGRFVQH